MRIHFAEHLDHVGMAKRYRQTACKQGLLRTLAQKAEDTPAITSYVKNVLFRWPAWQQANVESILADLKRIRETGLGVNLFFPKWSGAGYSENRNTATTASGTWQAWLQDTPVPGGWPAAVAFAEQTRRMGCLLQGFLCPSLQDKDGLDCDPAHWPRNEDGKIEEGILSSGDDVERNRRVLDHIQRHGLRLDVMYYDCYSAYQPLPEDFTPGRETSRRQNIENQRICLAETRRRGIMPGGEVARFWCMDVCDYFFFTDWSRDRLTNVPSKGAPKSVGIPIPLFELVFHDCYAAGFSGGGYAKYVPGYDWWPDRTPRLYELLFASAPAYNWLPMPEKDMPIPDWGSPHNHARFDWLRRWSDYHAAVAMSEMTNHVILDEQRQRIEFANGVTAELDFAHNLCRLHGVPSFTGDWEPPAKDMGDYAYAVPS